MGKATQFQPGSAGNPLGRGGKLKALKDAYKDRLTHIDEKTGLTNAEAIVDQVIAKAKRGNMSAAMEVANRTEGKAMQPIFVDTGIDQKTCEIIADLASRFLDPGPTAAPRVIQANELHALTCECSPCLQKRFAQSEEQTAKQLSEVKLLGKADAGPEQRTDRAQLRDGLAVPVTASSYGPSYSIPMDLQGDIGRAK